MTLTGAGGIGKSRVALRVMEDERTTYRDGHWAVDLSLVTDPDLLAPTVAEAVGLRADVAVPDADLVDFLANRKCLLVLDGCEQALEAIAELVLRLREECPELRILATSRQRLGISGEAVVLVEPMTVPDPSEPVTADTLAQFEAVALFVDRASLASAAFRLTDDNAQAVAELCAALEGVPLAVELAAARIGTLSPGGMLRQLTNRYGLLDQGYRDAPERLQSLRACVDWSFDACTLSQQELWCRMSVFTGGCDLADAVAVCADDGQGADEILAIVGSLVEKSVVGVTHAPDGSDRYLLLDFVAQYGRQRLREASLLEQWQWKHAQWCADLAADFRANWIGARQAELLNRLSSEHGNLRAALEFLSTDPAGARTGLVMATDLDFYWLTAGLAREARHWLEVGLARASGYPAERALAMVLAARYAYLQSDMSSVRLWLEQAWPEAQAADDGRTLGLLDLLTATVAVWEDDADTAVTASHDALRLLRESGDKSDEMLAMSIAGVCLGFAGDRDGAVAALEQAIALCDELGETSRRSFSLTGLGEQALAAGDADRAAGLFAEALQTKVELGDRMGVAVGLDSLGRVALADGDGHRAALLLGAAQSIWDAIGMHETRNPFASAGSTADGIVQARRLLGTQDFRAEFRRGSAIPEEKAVRYALGQDLDSSADWEPSEASPLTRRETEVADLVGQGLSNPEIAERLTISVRTAQGHVENILRKLGFTSRAMIAAWVAHRQAQLNVALSGPG